VALFSAVRTLVVTLQAADYAPISRGSPKPRLVAVPGARWAASLTSALADAGCCASAPEPDGRSAYRTGAPCGFASSRLRKPARSCARPASCDYETHLAGGSLEVLGVPRALNEPHSCCARSTGTPEATRKNGPPFFLHWLERASDVESPEGEIGRRPDSARHMPLDLERFAARHLARRIGRGLSSLSRSLELGWARTRGVRGFARASNFLVLRQKGWRAPRGVRGAWPIPAQRPRLPQPLPQRLRFYSGAAVRSSSFAGDGSRASGQSDRVPLYHSFVHQLAGQSIPPPARITCAVSTPGPAQDSAGMLSSARESPAPDARGSAGTIFPVPVRRLAANSASKFARAGTQPAASLRSTAQLALFAKIGAVTTSSSGGVRPCCR
jgi:hypothetical protein